MTPEAKARATIKFTLEMAPETSAKLDELSKLEHIPKVAVLRRCIDAAHAHKTQNSPRCADTTPCRCPQAHYVVPTPHYGPPSNAIPPKTN